MNLGMTMSYVRHVLTQRGDVAILLLLRRNVLSRKELWQKVSSPHVANLLTLWRTYFDALEHRTALRATNREKRWTPPIATGTIASDVLPPLKGISDDPSSFAPVAVRLCCAAAG
jgi:hypothetical protein